MATRVFTASDQARFAAASADLNPIHVDAVAARRTQAGAPVVHGVHVVLWALDAAFADGHIVRTVASLEATMHAFVYLDEPVAARIVAHSESEIRITIECDGVTAVSLRIGTGAKDSGLPGLGHLESVALPPKPLELDMSQIRGSSGRLPAMVDGAVAGMFPHAGAALGAVRVDAVARLSTLVGMVCPGLHSIFGAFRVQVARLETGVGLGFVVRNVDERVRMAEIQVGDAGIQGWVRAFVRKPPVAPPRMTDIAALVRPDEFRRTTALVIGGSRGLGAATAKAIAAGGGRVIITYAVGEGDAREIAEEIGPGMCRVLRYDVRESAAEQLAELPWDVTQAYYFATPPIFRRASEVFSAARFAELLRVYVDGFAALSAALFKPDSELALFYPSSVFVEDRPRHMTEYAMAKAAGEVLCADLARFRRGLRILVRRLPRVETDQTSTILPASSAGAVEVMLPVVRDMHAT